MWIHVRVTSSHTLTVRLNQLTLLQTLSRRTSIFFIADKGLKRRRWQHTDSEHITTLHKSHDSLWSDVEPEPHLQLLDPYRGLVRERHALTAVLSVKGKQKPAEYHSTERLIYSSVLIVIFGLEVIQKSQWKWKKSPLSLRNMINFYLFYFHNQFFDFFTVNYINKVAWDFWMKDSVQKCVSANNYIPLKLCSISCQLFLITD